MTKSDLGITLDNVLSWSESMHDRLFSLTEADWIVYRMLRMLHDGEGETLRGLKVHDGDGERAADLLVSFGVMRREGELYYLNDTPEARALSVHAAFVFGEDDD